MSKTPRPDEQRKAAQEAGGNVPPARVIKLTPASAIKPEPVIWAWEDNGHGRIPSGSLGLAAGREGTGKSSWAIHLAAQVTAGTLAGAWKGEPRAVIYLAVEDSWKYTIVPRLLAARADLDAVYQAEVQTLEGETVSLSLPTDNKQLEQVIRAENVALVVLDPLISAISDHLDTHVNRQVRQALEPLARIADRTGAVVLGVSHFNKSAGTDASSLITGSGAFKEVARFIFAFATDQEGGVVTQTKNSLGLSGLPSLAYRIINATVETAKGDAHVGRFVLDGVSERTVADVLGLQGEDRDEKSRAETFLKAALAGGPKPTAEVKDEAKNAHNISERTFERARRELQIEAKKVGTTWYIALPEHKGNLDDLPAPEVKAANTAKGGTVGKVAKAAKSSSPHSVGSLGNLAKGNARARTLAETAAEEQRARDAEAQLPARLKITGRNQ